MNVADAKIYKQQVKTKQILTDVQYVRSQKHFIYNITGRQNGVYIQLIGEMFKCVHIHTYTAAFSWREQTWAQGSTR